MTSSRIRPAILLTAVALLAVELDAQAGCAWRERTVLSSPTYKPSVRARQFAIERDLAAIGANTDGLVSSTAGAVFAWARSGGSWISAGTLTPSDATPGARFGWSVAMESGLLAVGAAYDKSRNPFQGSAYVFVHDGGRWIEAQKLEAADGAADDYFGAEVAVCGGTIVVAASGGPAISRGPSLYVFAWNGTAWTERQKLELPRSELRALALHGDTLVAGTSTAVYVATRQGKRWAITQTIPFPPGTLSRWFAAAVDVHDDTLVIGDAGHTPLGERVGGVHLFQRVGSTWMPSGVLTASDGVEDDLFGSAVALEPDRLLVGAPGVGVAGLSPRGAAYFFERVGGTWIERQKLAPQQQVTSQAGLEVDLSNDFLVVGDRRDGFTYRVRRATVTSRTAGGNLRGFTATEPVMGKTWSASVDLGASRHTHAVVIGFASKGQRLLPSGQYVLGDGHELFALPLRAGPVATWSVSIPDDCALAGTRAFAQAAHVLGGGRQDYTNALDLVLGY